MVQAVGSAVTRVQPGDRVAINPSHACGHCDYCRGGRGNLCRRMFFLGSASIFPHAQGMFRERFVMRESQLTPLDPVTEAHISLGEIACAEPLSIGLHALHRAGPNCWARPCWSPAPAPSAAMCVMAARLAGAAEVIVCDMHDRALAIARQVGADRTCSAPTRWRPKTGRPGRGQHRSRRPALGRAGHLPERPRSAAAASSRWARCRPKGCPSRPTSVMAARARLPRRLPRPPGLRLGGAGHPQPPGRRAPADQRPAAAVARPRGLRAGAGQARAAPRCRWWPTEPQAWGAKASAHRFH